MPSGIYERKKGLKRNVGEEARQIFRENLRKAHSSEKSLAAKVKNAGKACAGKTSAGYTCIGETNVGKSHAIKY